MQFIVNLYLVFFVWSLDGVFFRVDDFVVIGIDVNIYFVFNNLVCFNYKLYVVFFVDCVFFFQGFDDFFDKVCILLYFVKFGVNFE